MTNVQSIGSSGGAAGGPADGPGAPGAPARAEDAWARWLESPPGQYLIGWERAQIDRAVDDVFGYHAVQLGWSGLSRLDFLGANRMPHHVYVETGWTPDPVPVESPDPHARARVRVEHFEELPFETQSIDLVVLPHVLEFSVDPHQVLREVDRILRPEGRVVITGLNPVSLWGLRQVAFRGWGAPFLPREGHFIGVPRLRDWCKLLSFQIEAGRYGCYRPPCRTQLWLDRMRFLDPAGDRWWPICGAVYLLSAVKRVRAMRLIGPAWKRQPLPATAAAAVSRRGAARSSAPGRPGLRLVQMARDSGQDPGRT